MPRGYRALSSLRHSTDSVLKGEGAPIGWNPYVASARFVAHRIEGDNSLNDLADQIAQKIAERSADLISRNAAPR
jgi:hypothetical protein